MILRIIMLIKSNYFWENSLTLITKSLTNVLSLFLTLSINVEELLYFILIISGEFVLT